MKVAGKAHAKLIVLGEHSILHSGQAIIYPVKELELRFTLGDKNDGPSLNGKSLERWQSDKIRNVMTAMNIDADLSAVEIQSDIPIGKGLGSSAALCVAMARSFYTRSMANADAVSLAKLAMAGEAVFHGTSSGADPFTISNERPLLYRMQNNEHRPLNLSKHSEYVFLLRDSGTEHATEQVIKKVNDLKTKNLSYFQSIIDRLKVNTTLGLKFIENEEFDRLGLLLQDSNRLLTDLGLSTASVENAIQSLLCEGALGAKMTGAGLGGYVFGLFPENRVPTKLRAGDLIVRCSGL